MMQNGRFPTINADDRALRQTCALRLRIIGALAAALAFPFVADRYWLTLANQIGIAAIGAIGLNMLVGFTGLISIGHGGFLAVGAYTAGLLAVRAGAPMWVTVPLASLMAAVVGTVFGLPAVRLKGLYLAIATLAAQEIIMWLLHRGDRIGLGESLALPPATLWGPAKAVNTDVAFYWIIGTCLVGTAVFSANVFRSRAGRALIAIRDQPIAAQAVGVDIVRYKLLAFALSSFLAGLAGALTAHYRGIISWERFTIDVSILYLSMIIIGGLGSVAGSISGAAFITLLPALLTSLGRAASGAVPHVTDYLPYVQQGAFGLAIVLCLLKQPEGMVKLWRSVNDVRRWPFSSVSGRRPKVERPTSVMSGAERGATRMATQPKRVDRGPWTVCHHRTRASRRDRRQLLKLNNVEVVYNDAVLALTGLTLEVPGGQIVALLGRNGAGKSTALKAISGLLTPSGKLTDGEIMFGGQLISQRDAAEIVRMGVFHVLEGRRVFAHLTVEENLRAGASTRRASIAGDLALVYGYFPRLRERRAQRAGFLSGGEQQMLAIGRALMARPRVMLLDEPSLGLAPRLVDQIFDIITRINTEQGTTILLVEQNARRALDVADYAYILENGRIVRAGTPAGLGNEANVREFYLGRA